MDTNEAYRELVEAGVDPDELRGLMTGSGLDDPETLDSATVRITVTVDVELNAEDLDGLTAEDEDEIADIALDVIEVYGEGVDLVDKLVDMVEIERQ